MDATLLIVAVYLPLLGFLINGFLSLRKINHQGLVSLVGVGSVALSFAIFVWLTIKRPSEVLVAPFFSWLSLEGLSLSFAYRLDGLSLFMAWIVTGIGALIHLYSTGYMKEERTDFARFFAYLNLFIFAMLHLVLGDNLALLFLGWEGVGLCSYLLIGFDHHKEFAAAAGKKAFITNRIGDAGFLIGIFLLFTITGSLQYDIIYTRLAGFTDTAFLNTVAFFLFIGAMGKSAQIPLYVWLPDAMAGPTPVSALIHAATMVTAGIFMIARLAPVFLGAPESSTFIAFIGAATALWAALIAVTQTDIKKVLAYSTVSQLGYMFMAMGVGAYGAGLFHLMTHAFFKALLFLGSGAVILALHHEQDMRKMGGLAKHLKLLAVLFWIGAMAISGIPGLSGFFSKDLILEQAYSYAKGGKILFALGLITAFLTSFYMYRLVFLTFYTQEDALEKMSHHAGEHAHHHGSGLVALGWTIYLPLIVLAFLSVVGGYVGLPQLITHKTPAIVTYFDKVLPLPPGEVAALWKSTFPSHTEEWLLVGSSVLAALLGFLLAFFIYQKKNWLPIPDGAYRTPLVRFSFHKFYVDELYQALLLNPIKKLAFFCYQFLDARLIDGMVDGLAAAATAIGSALRRLQSGFVGDYALYLVLGLMLAGFLVLGGIR